MNVRVTVLIALAGLGIVSCNGSNPPPPDNRAAALSSRSQPQTTADAKPLGNAQAGAPRKPAMDKGDVPPADAQFTLFCDVVRGPGHVQKALSLKQELIRDTGRQGWHVIHGDDQSTLYYGYYRTFDDAQNDPQEVARAQADRRMIESLRDPLGDRRFRNSMFVPVNSPDPEAPPEWNLANAPANMFWSLQIAAYQGSPARKQAAVDSVRDMRAHGIPAYYYHGETISSVCVGAWPRSAVKEQGVRDDAHSVDPSQTIVVFSDKLPPNVSPEVFDDQGRRALIEAPKLEIQDPTLNETIKKFPYHAVNGEVHARSGGGVQIPDSSFLVIIPHHGNGVATDSITPRGPEPAESGADTAAGAILDQQPAQQPGAGKLRSIGDR